MSNWIEIDTILINLDQVTSIHVGRVNGNVHPHKIRFEFEEGHRQQFGYIKEEERDAWYETVKTKVRL